MACAPLSALTSNRICYSEVSFDNERPLRGSTKVCLRDTLETLTGKTGNNISLVGQVLTAENNLPISRYILKGNTGVHQLETILEQRSGVESVIVIPDPQIEISKP